MRESAFKPILGPGVPPNFSSRFVTSWECNRVGFRTKLPESEMVAPKYRGFIRKISRKTWELKHVPSISLFGVSRSIKICQPRSPLASSATPFLFQLGGPATENSWL